VGVGVRVGVLVAVIVAVHVGVLVAVGVLVGVAVIVGVLVAVGVCVSVAVAVSVGVWVAVAPDVAVLVGVAVAAPLRRRMYAFMAGMVRFPLTACPLLYADWPDGLSIFFQPLPTLTVCAVVFGLTTTRPFVNSRFQT